MAKHKPNNKNKINTPAKESKKNSKTNASVVSMLQRKNLLALAVVLLITLIVFYPVLSLEFVNWDDPDNLLDNKNLKIFSTQWDWNAVKLIFTTDVIGNYNPLPIFTFALEKYFFAPEPEANPFVFHFNNLLMHLACTALVFFLLLQFDLGLIAAVAGSLLFGIHPMRVESVAWVTERKDVLFGMFFLFSLLTYCFYIKSESSKRKWYIITLVLSVFSYFAKIQAVTLPLTMVVVDFLYKRDWLSIKVLIIEKLPWLILSLAIGLINIYFLKNNQSFEVDSELASYSFIDRLAIGAYSYGVYLLKWIYPYEMSPLYPYPKQLPAIIYISLAVVPLLVGVFLYWVWKTKKNYLLFGWAFFTFNVMFLLQIVGAGQGFLADRFTYIAYIGLFFITAKGYEIFSEKFPVYKTIVHAAGVAYLLLFGYMTYNQIGIWKNGETLWEHVKSVRPNSPLAWKQAGYYYRDKKKDYQKAIENYSHAEKIDPKDHYVYNGLAKSYIDYAFSLNSNTPDYQKKQKELFNLAIQNYNLAITKDSIAGKKNKKNTGEFYVNRGVAYAGLGNMEKALADLNRGLEINPENANGYLNRGLIYFQIQKYELTIKDNNSYLKLNPFNADVIHESALAKTALGRFDEAMIDYNKAISLKKNQPLYYISRARAYKYMGKKTESLRDAQQAKMMGAQVPDDLLRQ
jgi:protein O-mannosyl-transferase